ncbi:uncharacterized protein DDB_G0284459-like, partial [Diaphorina citri]|uniref:Uncharacterized protein DDB_G0284459-like n=1 Tax=Diaphorina citri TaxID=121845 RepID=A0A3Q0IZH4_DIACI
MFNMKVTVHTPTRVANGSSSCVDNIIVNFPTSNLLNTLTNIFSGLGDHKYAQVVSLQIGEINEVKKILARTYKPVQIENFKRALSLTDFSSIYTFDDVNDKMLQFYSIFSRLFNECFPYKTISISDQRKKRKSWLTPGIIISSTKKRSLHQLCRYSRDPALHAHYRQYSKMLSKVVRAAKVRYTIDQIDSAPKHKKIKTIWNIVRSYSKTTKKQHVELRLVGDRGEVKDPHTVAEMFNKYFVEIPLQFRAQPPAPLSSSSSLYSSSSATSSIPTSSTTSFIPTSSTTSSVPTSSTTSSIPTSSTTSSVPTTSSTTSSIPTSSTTSSVPTSSTTSSVPTSSTTSSVPTSSTTSSVPTSSTTSSVPTSSTNSSVPTSSVPIPSTTSSIPTTSTTSSGPTSSTTSSVPTSSTTSSVPTSSTISSVPTLFRPYFFYNLFCPYFSYNLFRPYFFYNLFHPNFFYNLLRPYFFYNLFRPYFFYNLFCPYFFYNL